jgi:ADP-ribose pyrophosphatase
MFHTTRPASDQRRNNKEAKMPLQVPKKIGPPTVLAKKFGKALISQQFSKPGKPGEEIEFCLFDWPVIPSIVMPVTKNGEVVAVKQFRYGANRVIIEFPGGNPKPGQTSEDVAFAEVEEETGYKVGELMSLAPPIYFEPAFMVAPYQPFLARYCTPTGKQKLDPEEYLEVMKVPLREWIQMIRRGAVQDSKTIAMTFLALRHLGVEFKFS